MPAGAGHRHRSRLRAGARRAGLSLCGAAALERFSARPDPPRGAKRRPSRRCGSTAGSRRRTRYSATITRCTLWNWAEAERVLSSVAGARPEQRQYRFLVNEHYLLSVRRCGRTRGGALRPRTRPAQPDDQRRGRTGAVQCGTSGGGRRGAAKAVAIDTTFVANNEYLGTAYVALRRYAEAVPVLRRAVDPAVRRRYRSGSSATRSRRTAGARRRKRCCASSSSGSGAATSPDEPGGAACRARRYDGDVRVAPAGVEGRDPFLIYNFVSDPIMAPFRRDPRGQAILRAMGLANR